MLAEHLEELIKNGSGLGQPPAPQPDEQVRNLFIESTPRRRLEELVLSDTVAEACADLVEEHHRIDLLRSFNLEPRHRVLLVGPPGNGKTSLAEALAEALIVPFVTIRYESVIGSFLGETAVRVRRLLDFVRTRRCVLFLDEFETLAKERGDIHESGEIKRVVSSLLLQMDDLPSYVVVVAATNHPELLDRAVWRRFQLRLNLASPAVQQLETWFSRFESTCKEPLGVTPQTLAKKFVGKSFAEVEEFCTDVMRRRALGLPGEPVKHSVARTLRQWHDRVSPTSATGD